MYFTINKNRKARPVASPTNTILHYHNPAARPAAPILNLTPSIRTEAKGVHWWNHSTDMRPAGFVPTVEPLPACGFFPPSASYSPFTLIGDADSDELPWVTLSSSNSDLYGIPVDERPERERTPAALRPLERVLTIARAEGWAIAQRRGTPKCGDLMGLGITLGHPMKRGGNVKMRKRIVDKENAGVFP